MEHLYPHDKIETDSKNLTSNKKYVTPDQRSRGRSSFYEGGSEDEDSKSPINPNSDGAGGTGGPVNEFLRDSPLTAVKGNKRSSFTGMKIVKPMSSTLRSPNIPPSGRNERPNSHNIRAHSQLGNSMQNFEIRQSPLKGPPNMSYLKQPDVRQSL